MEALQKTQHLKVLIFEDEPDDAHLVRLELMNANFSFEAKVVDAKDTLIDALKTFKPDLILADYMVPGINGFEALGLSLSLCPMVPFVFVTGAIGEDLAAETILDGASGFVLKKNLNRLPRVVEKAFDRAKRKNAEKRISEFNESAKLMVEEVKAYRNKMDEIKQKLTEWQSLSTDKSEELGEFVREWLAWEEKEGLPARDQSESPTKPDTNADPEA